MTAIVDEINALVKRFESRNKADWDEEQTKISLLNPFWCALGWEVANPQMVVVEKRTLIEDHLKRADYAFLEKGRAKFLVEAKQPSKDLTCDKDAIFQLKRYVINTKDTFLGILHDFEEFVPYIVIKKPDYNLPTDGLRKNLVFRYDEYADRIDELLEHFSREAVLGGSIENLLPKGAKLEKTTEILNKEFFSEIMHWRLEIAKSIAKNNPQVNDHDINSAVNHLLNRILFLRVIEDRKIENYDPLDTAVNKWKREELGPLFAYLIEVFKRLNPKYNGAIFEQHAVDNMIIDDKPLYSFIRNLYYPQSIYQFSEMPIEVIGNAYEQYLGSVLRTTPKRQVKLEEKPEVRKAGGVYYTPKYIVDYIVEQTVGALVEGRTNESSLRGSEATKQSHATDEEIAALPSVARNDRNKKNKMMTPAQVSKLRILDPACGSGSFLIGAFERLQKYYIDYYTANPKKNKGYLREDYEGNPKLDILVKKKILEENIYGVDIDPQAVDITEFSLYVKMLEGEENLPMFAETYLPKLKNNIKCGNSLIGWDILDMDILPTDPDERQAELERINPFDWEREFPEVLSPHPIADQSPHPKSFSQGEKDLGPPSPFGRGTEGEDSSARGTECESPHPESFSQGESPHPESFSQGEKDLGPPSPFGRGTEGEGTYRYSPKYIIELARELRKKSNKPEELMWYLLRDRRFHGLKFRRQHPIDRYIADFYCHELKLVIELDGLVHEGEYQKEYDENRNEYMIASGYNVLRIDADEVMNDCENVLKRIEDEVMALSPHPIADQSPHPKSFSQGEKDLGPPSPFGRGTEGEGSSTGFDAVIGNPPWISITGRFRNEVFLDGEIQYMIDRFKGNTYMPNIYEYFVSQGFNITKQDGYFSFIVPDRLAYNRQFVQLRSKLLEHSSIQVILFRPVFPGITADTMIFSLKKGKPKKNHEIEVSEFGKESVSIYQSRYKENEGSQWNYFENRKIISLIDRIEKDKQIVRLNELIRTTSGFGGKSQKITENKISPKQIPVIKGDCIGRYVLLKNYFFEFIRDNITGRTTDRNKLGAKPKVLLRKTGNCIIATYTENDTYPEQSLYFLFDNQSDLSYLYFLGLLNSQFINFYYQVKSLTNRASIAQVKKMDLDKLPIRAIDFDDPEDVALHDRMVSLVEEMLELNKRLRETESPSTRKSLEAQIEHTDRKIDELVYELYGLTEKEIRIVESN